MKPIEEAFSSTGFRGVVLPGVVFTIGVHPLFANVLRRFQSLYGISESAILLVAEVIVWGLLISSATNGIYYVYEGFSWPWLTSLARRSNERRLRAAVSIYEKLISGREFSDLGHEEKVGAALAHEVLADFPLQLKDGRPTRYVERSTLLGNIITSYELYPRTRYDIDGVYFWFHLIAFAPSASATEFHERYALAESIVLTSFAGAAVAVLNAIVLIGYAIGSVSRGPVIANLLIGPREVAAFVAFGLVVFFVFYLLALPAHRKVSQLFCAMVDLAITGFNEWSAKGTAPLDVASVTRIANRKRYLNVLKPPRT